MEKILANFLKSFGLTPEVIESRMAEFLAQVENVGMRLERLEARQVRLETMLIRMAKKAKINLADIYEPIDNAAPVIEHDPAQPATEPEQM